MSIGDVLGDAGDVLSDASNIIGGYVPEGLAPGVNVMFTRGEKLGNSDPDIGGAHPPEDLGTHDTGAPIEFIHFGYVHPDDSKPFEHTDRIDDSTPNSLGQGPNHRAIMFRAALEREAILLSGFISSTQKVLLEKERRLGGLGEVISAVSDLVGGGGGSAAPKAADLNAANEKVAATAGSINSTNITYGGIHNAGIGLHHARAIYRDFLKKVMDKPGGDEQPGLLSSVDAIASALPGVGGIFSTIAGIATKAFDIYIAFYTKIAWDQEKAIERTCHKISIKSIEKNAPVIYPVWAPIPEDTSASDEGSDLPGFLGTAEDAVDGAVQDVRDFFGDSTPVDCPGSGFLPEAFLISEPPPRDQPPPPPKTLGSKIVEAFTQQLNFLPDPIPGIIEEIVEINADFVNAVYQRLMEKDPNDPIEEEAVYEAGRRRLLDRLVNLLISQVSFLEQAKNAGVKIQDVDISAGKLLDKGLDELNEELGSKLDPIFHFTMKHFAWKLEGLRNVGVTEKAHTMELYLGRLPYLLALLFRDTFFPVWDLIIKYVFGSIGGPLGDFMDSFSAFREEAQEYIDAARDYVTKAEKVADRAEREGLHAGTGSEGENISGYQQDLASTADRAPNPEEESVKSTFPFTARQPLGAGRIVILTEWEAVSKNHKWETARPE